MLGCLLAAAPAAAFTPPEVFVRLTHANSIDHTPVSDWMPLSAAPRLNWLGGYEVGYRFQDAPGTGAPQRAALEVAGVPDGQPSQPLNTPYCSGGPGTVGEIVPVGTAIQFEGVGTYTVTVSVGAPSGGQNDCRTGPGSASSTGSFTVDAGATPAVSGSPLIYRFTPLAGNPFVGVSAPAPPGGEAETRCARDATINPDGSVTGPLVVPAPGGEESSVTSAIAEGDSTGAEFGRPGAWTCVARGYVEGKDENIDTVIFTTPWSAPLRLDVRSDFRRAKGQISKPKAKRPQFRFTAEFPEVAGGGNVQFRLQRLTRCKGSTHVFKTVGTYGGRFDAKGRANVTIKRPRAGFYIGRLSFSGTRFYTKSIDPNPALLAVSGKGKLSYVSRQAYPTCPGFP